MPSIDMPLEKLVDYRPAQTVRPDFGAFWDACLAESKGVPLNAEFVPVEDTLPLARVYDVAYDGVDGVRVKGWFLTPKEMTGPLPTVVQFIGYSGGRDHPHALAPATISVPPPPCTPPTTGYRKRLRRQ